MATRKTREAKSVSESGGSLTNTGLFNLKALRETRPDFAPERKDLATSLLWLTIARCIFLASTAVLVALVLLSTQAPLPGTIPWLLRVAAVGFVISLIYIWLRTSSRISLVRQAYIQFVGDLFLVSALVYTTGGALSSFSMLYLVVIAAAATILKRRAGLTVAEIAWLLYASIVVSLYVGWPIAPGPASSLEGSVSVGRLAYELFIHLIGFYAVAYLTSALSNQEARARQELAAATGDLEALEVFHRDVVQSMSSGLVLLDLNDKIISINRVGRKILGLSPKFEGTHLQDLEFFQADHWQALLDRAHEGRIRDEVVITRDAQERTVGYSVGVIHGADDQLKGHSVVFQDLTDWRRLQADLSVKERMAAVGELAAGLAHEIGNPLAAISGSVQMLQSSGEPGSADSKLLTIVLKESQRLDRTIKGFLQFAKPHEKRDGRFDICELIAEHLELFGNSSEVTAKHDLLSDLDPTHCSLVADRDQISQVFWNLSRNSIRAMPDGGTLRVVGRLEDSEHLGEQHVSSETERPASQACYLLRFCDDGVGMSDEQRHGLFHPFHSHQGGMGIGMAIVYRIIQAHNGSIDVSSEVGVGTTIEIRLPAQRPT